LFSTNPDHGFGKHLLGVIGFGAFVLITSAVLWLILRFTIGLRVSDEEETNGLDQAEHGLEAYPEFKSTTGVI
jgi:Amt family ammonium transporter